MSQKEPINFGIININENLSNNEIDFTLFHNESNPVIKLGTISLQLGNAEDVGILHNYVIQQIYSKTPEFLYESDRNEIAIKICEELEHLGFDFEILDIKNALIDEVLLALDENIETEEIIILNNYFERVSQLSTSQAIEYTRQFQQIVLNSGIDEFSSIWIRGAISVAVNSKILWNLNLPDPEDEYLFLVINEDFTYADLLPWEQAKLSIIAGQGVFAGILV